MSNYKTVFFTLGVLQIILGLSMIIPIIIQFIYNEIDSSFIGCWNNYNYFWYIIFFIKFRS